MTGFVETIVGLLLALMTQVVKIIANEIVRQLKEGREYKDVEKSDDIGDDPDDIWHPSDF